MNQYKFKQDLAQVYFEGYDQEVARRLLAREIHGNAELMDAAPQVKATLAEPFHKVFLAE